MNSADLEAIVSYFRSDQWRGFIAALERGRVVRHAHAYTRSRIHPASLRSVIEVYFSAYGVPLERKIKLISHGTGLANLYYIQPKNMAHFEVMANYSADEVLVPNRIVSGLSYEYWDDEFMTRQYAEYDFRPVDASARKELEAFFLSEAWFEMYRVMIYNDRYVHSHLIVETGVSPEEIAAIGVAALEQRGWEVDRAVSVIFNIQGHQGKKVSFILRRPETVLELEWEFNPTVVIRPIYQQAQRLISLDTVKEDLEDVPYQVLSGEELAWIGDRFNQDLKRV